MRFGGGRGDRTDNRVNTRQTNIQLRSNGWGDGDGEEDEYDDGDDDDDGGGGGGGDDDDDGADEMVME